MATSRGTNKLVYLQRVVDIDYLTANEIYEKFLNRSSIACEIVTDKAGNPIPFDFEWPSGISADQKKWTADDEVKLAIAIHEAMVPARQDTLAHLVDKGIWTWIALFQIEKYVVNRWCGQFDSHGRPNNRSSCSAFLTGESMQRQTRCASRRLYLAADTCFRADGDYKGLPLLMKNTDVYSSIFERKLGIDPELAVEFAEAIHGQDLKRGSYRKAIKLMGLILGTTCLEFLTRNDKRDLIKQVIEESSSSLVTA